MNNTKFSIQDITNKFLELETRFNLLEWKIDGVFVWQSARRLIYTRTQDLLISHISHQPKTSLIELIKIIYERIFINTVLLNPFWDFEKKGTLIFESSVKYFKSGDYIDIYTQYFAEELDENKISYTKYQSSYSFDKLSKNRKAVKHLDFIILLSKLISKFIIVRIDRENEQKIKTLNNLLNDYFKINIDIRQVFINEIKVFKSQYPFYSFLLKKKNANTIYVVNSSSKIPLIKAAKDNNITVIELQHGILVKEDLIYHYPNTQENSLDYFPNKFYVLKDNINTSKLPISESNISIIENKHLKLSKKEFSHVPKEENQILVVSQHTLTKEILSFIINNICYLETYKIIYKLHAFEQFDDTFSALVKFHNITIVCNEQSIYKLFSQSKYVIGVYSTALFEAASFGCKILLINLPGVIMAQSLIESKHAVLINSGSELKKYLDISI